MPIFTAKSYNMPQYPNRQFLDFEQPIKNLYEDREKLKQTAEKSKIDLTDSIQKIEEAIIAKRKEITENYFIDIGIPEDYKKAQKEIPNYIRMVLGHKTSL